MAKLAIKGHPTRGEEVIEILEILGGKNYDGYNGLLERIYYYIDKDGKIECDYNDEIPFPCVYFTLEEFLEKFPYKVGDKILYKTYGIYSKIKTMLWNVEKEQVFYRLESNKLFVATADELQPRKEETTDKTNKATFDYNAQCCDIMNHLIKEKTIKEIIKINIPAGYEFAGVDDDNQQVVFEKIGCQYPKTYEECCKVLGKTNSFCFEGISLDEVERIRPFIKLLRCRNAYWKIAGEQMGLGGPWKYDMSKDEFSYAISYQYGRIQKNEIRHKNAIFAFPTAEMRDAFKENFDDDIEFCKEFL